jgi:hypothetical protein
VTSTTSLGEAPKTAARAPKAIGASALAVALAFAYGGLTSLLQLIPGPLNGLANTVSGWTMPVIALTWLLGGRPLRAAITFALAFVALCAGYSVVSTLRGYPDFETMWAAIGLVAGPVIGAAASLLRHGRAATAAVSAAVLAGILLGDASFGFVNNAQYWATWVIAACAAVALLVVVALRRPFSARLVALELGTTVVVAGAYWLAFAGLNAATMAR